MSTATSTQETVSLSPTAQDFLSSPRKMLINGDWVDGTGRNAAMTRDRDTLIRVHHTLAEGWTPRLLEAHRDALSKTAEQLLEKETLGGDELPVLTRSR